MAKSIFVTATGTDIGKTYISGLVVKKMKEFGFNCGYFKPVLSGLLKDNDGNFIPGDCKHVVDTAGLNLNPTDCLSYSFVDAVSPHLASERAGKVIDTNKIISDYQNISKGFDYMLIEGAGGITCPLRVNENENYLMSDLIKDLGQDILLVADSGLGTLNHILTTVEFAKNKNICIKGIVLNNFDNSDFMHTDNLLMTERLTGLKVIATVEKNANTIDITPQELRNIFG